MRMLALKRLAKSSILSVPRDNVLTALTELHRCCGRKAKWIVVH